MENVYLLRFGDQILKRFVSLSASSNRPAACPRPAFLGSSAGKVPFSLRASLHQENVTMFSNQNGISLYIYIYIYIYIYMCAIYIYIYISLISRQIYMKITFPRLTERQIACR